MFDKKLIESLIEISIDAGKAIIDIYKYTDDIQIERKDDDSPLTIADKKANEIIVNGLKNLDEKYPIISEENAEIPFSERKNFEFYWLVDPLDGTKEFIKRNGEFTTNIALINNGKPIVGVVYAPLMREVYFAQKGKGAFKRIGNVNSILNVSKFKTNDEGLKMYISRSHANEETKEFVNKFNNPILLSKGSSLKFLSLAQGDADIYPRFAPTSEWDTAAAQIILEEAGGKILNLETKEPLFYNKENLINPYFIALGNVKKMSKILKMI